MAIQPKTCEHLQSIEVEALKQKKAYECEICAQNGDTWVHLRTCQACGITLCCDSSPNKHASKHAKETGHPVAISAEPGEQWMWCYQDKTFRKY